MKIKVNISGAAFTGKVVTFTAPCDCTEATGLLIGEDVYDVVDAVGERITGSYLAWRGGAVVSVALDCENKKAFIQNAATSDKVKKSGDTMTGALCINKGNGQSYFDFDVGNNALYLKHTSGNNAAQFTMNNNLFSYSVSSDGGVNWALNHILHTGNKPMGSYTGNGDTTQRTFAIGDVAHFGALLIVSTGGSTAIVTAHGVIYQQGATIGALAHTEGQYGSGNLAVQSANSALNASGVTYYYQVL